MDRDPLGVEAGSMKRAIKVCAALAVAFLLTVSAFAILVPTDTYVQNLNGVQQYIKVYTVPAETDPQELIEDTFAYNGYVYKFADITKQENELTEQKEHTETVTVETSKKDLSVILEQLAPTMEYDDGQYSGVLALDHTTIQTEAAGYTSGSYTIRATREIGNLDSNDMSYVPATTIQDGKSIPLESVEWRVQSTALVDDVLVPSSYVAVATYAGKSSYSTPTGYVSTADYVGTVSRKEIRDVTYTVTYEGTEGALPAQAESDEDAESSRVLPGFADQVSKHKAAYIIGGIAALLIIGLCVFLIIRLRQMRKRDAARYEEPEMEEEHEEE